jgi:hypothetical protein
MYCNMVAVSRGGKGFFNVCVSHCVYYRFFLYRGRGTVYWMLEEDALHPALSPFQLFLYIPLSRAVCFRVL